MKAESLKRRLAALEDNPNAVEEVVPFSFRWVNEDGTPASPLVERMVPKDSFRWLNKHNREN
jgi:hypothetical protein